MQLKYAVVLVIAACGRVEAGDMAPPDAAAADGGVESGPIAGLSFDMSVTPSSIVLVAAGAPVDVHVHVTRLGDFVGPVTLEGIALPPGITATTPTVAPNETDATVSIAATATAQQALAATIQIHADTLDAGSLNAPVSVFVRGCPGCLDETFGAHGVAVLTNLSGGGLAVDTSGAVLLPALDTSSYGMQSAPGLVVKLGPTGALDKTFGVGGRAQFSGANDFVALYAIDLLPSGAIVVGGGDTDTSVESAPTATLVARLLPSGALDTSFASTGVAESNDVDDSRCESVRALGDGSLVLLQTRDLAPNGAGLFVGHYAPDGSFDTAFGYGGWTELPWGSLPDGAGLAIDASGRIIAGGRTDAFDGDFVVSRLLTTGAFDATFGTSGTTSDSRGGMMVGLTTAATGVIGAGRSIDDKAIFVSKWTATGARDTTFGNDGGVVSTVDDAGAPFAQSVSVTSSNDVIVLVRAAGTFIHRYTPSGADDATFGTSGTVRLDGPKDDTEATGMALYALDRVVVRISATTWKGTSNATIILRLWL